MGVDDRPLGRCALPLRALAHGAIYDAWLPLRLHASRAEEVAVAGRVLVDREDLAEAAAAHETQRSSRGALRVRL